MPFVPRLLNMAIVLTIITRRPNATGNGGPLSATPSAMSVGRPTVLPRDPIFPLLLPTPPQPHPVPYQKSTNLDNVRRRRNLEKEMDELSDEENELEDMVSLNYSVTTTVNAQ